MIKALIRRAGLLLKDSPDRFFKKVRGVVHVGANTGQEIKLYEKNKLSSKDCDFYLEILELEFQVSLIIILYI